MINPRRWFPFLQWSRPDAATTRGEIIAGLTVSMIVVPQSVAYAALAGMPLITGIYAAFLPALVAVLWSASPRLSVGPTALSSLLVMASLAGLAAPGSAEWVALAVWLSLLSGLMQLALGVGRFGWIVNVVSAPVLAGFTQAATVLIIGSQLSALVGVHDGWSVGQGLPSINIVAAAFGLGTLTWLVIGKKLAPNAPLLIIAIVGAGAISYFIGVESKGCPSSVHCHRVYPVCIGPVCPHWEHWGH